ncbi:biotin--[acetyl-CoA-carboxylase] ligase [Archaeoglobus sp.]
MRITKQSTDYQVYRILSDRQSSGEEIGKKLGITRSAVWKTVNKMKESGVKIESSGKGYVLIGKNELNPYEIADITFKRLGDHIDEIIYFETTDSTNEKAKEYGKPRTLIFAESQTAGKGRLGRRWESQKGGLYFTLSLDPKLDYTEMPKVTLIAGLSVAEALPEAKIKWPNDVLIRGKKVCGILSELYGEIESPLIVVGIGINVSNPIPDELKDYAASVSDFYSVGRREIFDSVLANFGKYYKKLLEGKWRDLRENFVNRCDTIGKIVKITTSAEEIVGVAEDIGDDGSLIVNGRRVYAGDCIHLRNYRFT